MGLLPRRRRVRGSMCAPDDAAYLDSMRAIITEHGHAVQAVYADADHPPWAYTIGLHAAGLPELIIIGGLDTDGQHRALNELAARLRSGDNLKPGQRDPSVLEGADVTYVDVVDTTTEDFAVALRLQADFRAIQVVWPDPENRFPWEPGYALPANEQRLLGPAPS